MQAASVGACCEGPGYAGAGQHRGAVMNEILDRLRLDHQRFERILGHLRRQVEAIRNGDNVDLELVREIICCCEDYADVLHHPVEDQMFDLMVARDPDLAPVVDALETDHHALAGQTIRLRQLIEAANGDSLMRREDFVAVCEAYLSLFERHMQREETEIFPHAERLLHEEDWHHLGSELLSRNNPLEFAEQQRRQSALAQALAFSADDAPA